MDKNIIKEIMLSLEGGALQSASEKYFDEMVETAIAKGFTRCLLHMLYQQKTNSMIVRFSIEPCSSKTELCGHIARRPTS